MSCYRCISLAWPNQKRLAIPLKDYLADKDNSIGFKIFFTNSGAIADVQTLRSGSGKDIHELFQPHIETIDEAEKMFDSPSGNNWQPKPAKLVLFLGNTADDFPERIYEIFRKIRAKLTDTCEFETTPGYALAQATAWELFIDRLDHSPFEPGQLGYDEYLLWDDGDLWETAAWSAEAKDRQAWLGAGWLRSRLAALCQDSTEVWPYCTEIDGWAKASIQRLQEYQTALAGYLRKKSAHKELTIPNLQTRDTYVRALCDFLPRRRSVDNPELWLPGNSYGDSGGPMPWRGLLDSNLSAHKRHLLLDGWLTLWPKRDQAGNISDLYVQPGSLALLYWAARYADLPGTDNPGQFMRDYDWSGESWFGGQWRRDKTQLN